jgi:hypothetical protein
MLPSKEKSRSEIETTSGAFRCQLIPAENNFPNGQDHELISGESCIVASARRHLMKLCWILTFVCRKHQNKHKSQTLVDADELKWDNTTCAVDQRFNNLGTLCFEALSDKLQTISPSYCFKIAMTK